MYKITTFYAIRREYTRGMRKVVAVHAPKPRSDAIKYFAWAYAAIITVMAVLQLFAFEDFLPLLSAYVLPGGDGMAMVAASLIAIVEVFALPFLLRMTLSPLMRWFSLVCSLAVAGAWLKLSVFAILTNVSLENSGLLGSKIEVATGLPMMAVAVGLLTLALVCVWGMWPLANKK